MPGLTSGPCPVVRFYGVTMEGNSVLCHVHGFLPYFYVPAPQNFSPDHCENFRADLNKVVLFDMRSNKDNVTTVSILSFVNCTLCLLRFNNIIYYTLYTGPAEALRQRRFWPQDFFAAKICFSFRRGKNCFRRA